MDLVFRYKGSFALSCLEDEEFSDFLMYMLPRFEEMFSVYDPERSCFVSYMYGCVRFNLFNWQRRVLQEECARESSCMNSAIGLEELKENYLMCEAPYDEGFELPLEEDVSSDGSEKGDNSPIPFTPQPGRTRANVGYWTENFQSVRTTALLVLALKSAAWITEDLIEKVCAETGCEENKFRDMLEYVLSTLEKRRRRREACIRSRDNAYFFRRKYMLSLLKLKDGSCMEEKVKSQFKRQDETWKRQNRKLSQKLFSMTPSNKTVAEALRISPRRVQTLLDLAGRNIDIMRSNCYHASHENLLGNRQSEQKKGNAGNFSSAYYSNAQRRRAPL